MSRPARPASFTINGVEVADYITAAELDRPGGRLSITVTPHGLKALGLPASGQVAFAFKMSAGSVGPGNPLYAGTIEVGDIQAG